ncbi:dTDP-4-dehydrorhamnose reductase [Chitinophaga horti]|uniref:dTDP-4-dehydrorhamnose reductase n=1 Tax=Chitinophaga horti TaxID=2920382 RepID=A0ABY6J1R3_9BACT|nr:dTDP-4-dehydrorhamnose reductase [Chitinophaga horti]UYQ93590.1 dTDP-4-dehydrorhamnose reductase [Chitinophaga horti]
MKKILVTGANGQLGKSLRGLASQYAGFEFLFADRETLDIADQDAVNRYFAEHQPDACINCAAYTAVDKAESDEDNAFAQNFLAVLYLSEACLQHNSQLLHISTDYVFDGANNRPYRETDETGPRTVYGSSKLKGEAAALDLNPKSIVVRTSWVYAKEGVNFVNKIKQLMQDKPALTVVVDQTGTPTYAPDLAAALLSILTKVFEAPGTDFGGVYHYSNQGVTSWFDFAVAIRDISGASCNISPVTSEQYPAPAPRPAYSVLNKEKIRTTFGLEIPYWRDSLEECLKS